MEFSLAFTMEFILPLRFVYLARKYTDCGLAAIKESLDNSITEVAVSKLFARTVAELKDNIGLRKDIEKLEEKIGV